jgi:Lrp/AsnC family transcriptional regulator, leucine-responsive regulatory protein
VHELEAQACIRGYAAQLDEARWAVSMKRFAAATFRKQSEAVIARFVEEIALSPELMSCFMMKETPL